MPEQPRLERLLRMIVILAGPVAYSGEELAQRFSVNLRTIRRYIQTIRQASFRVTCSQGRYSIPRLEEPFKEISELVHFSEEEAYILSQAIHSIDETNLLKSNLVKKLYSLYNFKEVADSIVRPENTARVHGLLEAISQKKQVLLRQYRSSHGSLVRDRLVEPFGFTTNYSFIWAYDPESRSCKLFKTERIGKVELLDQDARYTHLHIMEPVDVFRISARGKVHVKLGLRIRAYNLLIEEYPLAEKFITQSDDNYWHFEADVCGFEGVGRFVLGLSEDVDILESQEFRIYLNAKIKKMTQKI